jgi:uncharacterized iron-regulated membrane protein
MKESFRQSMAWLHTWSGVVFGWLLFVMFACGSCAYFQEEITRWMQPELSRAGDQISAANGAARWLEQHAPTATNWYITPPGRRSAVTTLYWTLPEGAPAGARTQITLDAMGQPVTARETAGGYFLYRFHFDLHYMNAITARYIVGAASMFMLVAILSGIVTHKKIFADFFLLRFGKGQRSWLDAHNVTAVLALPFHLMITYTGLVTLDAQLAPAAILANYTSGERYFADAFPQARGGARADRAAPLAPLEPMMIAARTRWHAADIGYITVAHPGDAAATVSITSSPAASMDARGDTLIFDGVSGRLRAAGAARGPAQKTEGVMIGLHAGRYADMPLRWLYFLSGVGGTIMVGTGLVLWTVKRRAKLADPARPHFGFRLVERSNPGVIFGFPFALSCYFLANRLLPLHLPGRAEWEIHCLFIAWGIALIWAAIRPAHRSWRELATAGALSFAAVPIVSAISTGRSLPRSIVTGDWLFAIFDLVMLVMAAAFALVGWRLATRRTTAPKARRGTLARAS